MICVSTNASRCGGGRPAMRSARPCSSSTPLPSVSAAVDSEWSRAVSLRHRDLGPDRVGAGPAGDGEQPRPPARLGAEARQGPPGPHEDVLGDVVGLVRADEVGRDPPHLRLAHPDRGTECEPIPVPSLDQEPGQLVHRREDTREPRCARGRLPGMDCDTAQSAISARLDGEDLGVDPVDLADHLERCTRAVPLRAMLRPCIAR